MLLCLAQFLPTAGHSEAQKCLAEDHARPPCLSQPAGPIKLAGGLSRGWRGRLGVPAHCSRVGVLASGWPLL